MYDKTQLEINDYLKKAEKLTKKLLRSKKACRRFLIKGGFCTKDGKLHPDYCDE